MSIEQTNSTNIETYLTPIQASKLLNVTTRSLLNWCDDGKLSVVKTAGGHRRYLKSEVDAKLIEMQIPRIVKENLTDEELKQKAKIKEDLKLKKEQIKLEQKENARKLKEELKIKEKIERDIKRVQLLKEECNCNHTKIKGKTLIMRENILNNREVALNNRERELNEREEMLNLREFELNKQDNSKNLSLNEE